MLAIVKNKKMLGADLIETSIPIINDYEVLVKVKSTSICGTDIAIYSWNQWAQQAKLNLPLIFGHEFSGEVVKKGKKVERFKIGDRVVGETHLYCGECIQCLSGHSHLCKNLQIYGVNTSGCFAEYTAIPSKNLWKIRDEVTYEIGAIFEPLGTAIRAAITANPTGKNVLVMGCGPMGLFILNTLRIMGANKILASDVSEYRLKLAERNEGIITMNGNDENFIDKCMDITSGNGMDVVIEASGANLAIQKGFEVLKKGGEYIFIGIPSSKVPIDISSGIVFKEAKITGIHGRLIYESWLKIEQLYNKLDIDKIITHTFKLESFQKAFKLALSGEAGKIILNVDY